MAAGVTGSGDLSLKRLKLPVANKEDLREFNIGDEILVDGILYTARDKVHAAISRGEAIWPFDLVNNGIFYCGPTPAINNFPLGSCGPTTSARMDTYTPGLYRRGLAVTIGKGPRGREVIDSIKEYGGLYLVAYGGCGALYGSKVLKAEIAGFKELGPQAVYRLEIKGFPVIVGIDFNGRDIFSSGFEGK